MILSDLKTSDLLSGFVGATLGVFASYGLFRLGELNTARRQLRDRLIDLKNPKGPHIPGEVFRDYTVFYENSFHDVWKLVLRYRETLPLFCRGNLDRAWTHYKGHPDGIELELYAIAPSQEEVFRRVDVLLGAVGYKSP